MGLAMCNRCRRGAPEFTGTVFVEGKVYHQWTCECGNTMNIFINPIGYDLDDPRAVKTMLLTRDYGLRIGLFSKSEAERRQMNKWEPVL